MVLVAHGAEEFIVVASAFHSVFDEFDGFDGGAVGEETAENPHAVEGLGAQQQVVAAGAGSHDVDGGEDALVGEGTVELEFHVAGAFEFFEDDFVHLGGCFGEGGGDYGERAAVFDVACGAEEAFGLLECVCVDAAGEDFARGGSACVVGACETCD